MQSCSRRTHVSQQRALFRSEALAFQQRGKMGEVVLLQPMPARLLFWSLVAAFVAIAAYLALAQYARKETVIGYLAPTAGVAKVFVPRSGIVTDVHVRESQIVEQGQPLLTVAIDQTAADGQNVDSVQLA